MMQSASNSKRRLVGEEDMISNLPDFIIGHILSFLTTKEAVLTSVLSKKWIYKWTLVTKLDLSDGYDRRHCPNNTSFYNFVNRVLFHLNTSTIEELSLYIYGTYYDSYYINQWLSALLNKRVKSIYLFSSKMRKIASYPLFNSQSLEKLRLYMNRLCRFCSIKVPSFVSLSSLTVLSFSGIIFTCYSSNELKELTLNFPLLREYNTRSCIWSGVKSITVQAPLLELVNITNGHTNNANLHAEIIKFSASHIKKFSFIGPIFSPTFLLDHQHIPSAFICLTAINNSNAEEIWILSRKLISLFINAECLRIWLPCYKHLAQVEHYLAGIPAFQMLGHLHLNVSGDVLLAFLLKSPCLKTLVLKIQMGDYDEESASQKFAVVPDCFLSTLKVVKFYIRSCSKSELSFAKFLMENAKVLEKITFCCLNEEKAKEKLNLVKIGFSTVIMEFCSYDDS